MNANPSYNPNYHDPKTQTAYATIASPSAAPVATAVPVSASPSTGINEVGAREYLSSCRWPTGLQDTFIANLSKIAMRYFICDDSGSMSAQDGHRLVADRNSTPHFVPCTRWQELTSALSFHATVASAARAPTQFRLLNGASHPITIGDSTDTDGSRLQTLLALFSQSPSGGTPLCAHIRAVIQEIQAIAPELRSRGQRACVVIASDGESSDGDVAQALKPLEHLPAWVVIRLCTDEDRIVNYWNNIDNDLELEMDVLDDLEGEAKEIAEVNPWLTYGEPLHRLREFGIPIKEIDLLDSHALNQDQMRLFCSLLFGGRVENYPHPAEDWREFQAMLTTLLTRSGPVFDPIKKRMVPWVHLKKMKKKAVGGCLIQ